MSRAEEAALKAYPNVEQPVWDESYPRLLLTRHIERDAFIKGYTQAEKDTIEKVRQQVERWMPDNPEGDEYISGERVAFRSVLHFLKELEEQK